METSMTLEEALMLTCCAVVFAFLLPFGIHWWQTRRDDHKRGSEGVEDDTGTQNS